MTIHTYYDNLKVARIAPTSVIKASYRALSQQYHPDKNNGSLESTRIMKIINQAYEVLSDPIQRAAYDEELRQKEAKIQQASSAQTKPSQSEPPAQEKPVKPPQTPQSSQKGTGWVYILSNKTFPNLVKIGMTAKTPEERAKNLDSNATGVPYRYVVEYKIRVNNHHKLEQAVHRDMKYCREDKGKEFFRCTVEDAIKSINKIINNDTFNQYVTPKKSVSQAEEAEQWFKLGLAAYSKQDYQTAFNYYQKAATQNNVDAQSNLGYMYQYGQGIIKDEATAVNWYQKAAQQGNVYSQNKLSSIYEKNIKAQKEVELQKAVAAQKEAEFQKSVAAQKEVEFQKAVAARKEAEQWFNLGMAAYNIQNYVIALDKFQKAANQGSAKAQYKLGVMYDNGYGIVKNERTAVEWFQKAAAQGDADAQKNLSLIYEKKVNQQKQTVQHAAVTENKAPFNSNKLNNNEQNGSWSSWWWLILSFIFLSGKLISSFTGANDKQNTVKNDLESTQQTFPIQSSNNPLTITTVSLYNQNINNEWLRCSLGQSLKNNVCTGQAKRFTFDEAQQAAKDFNAQGGFAGYADWRIPSIREITSLRMCTTGFSHKTKDLQDNNDAIYLMCNEKSSVPTINQINFPNTPSGGYWSSSQYTDSTTWRIGFGNGYISHYDRNSSYYVRLIRGAGSPPQVKNEPVVDINSKVLQNDPTVMPSGKVSNDEKLTDVQFNSAIEYATSQGVFKSERTAIQWYKKTAEQGYAKAQFELGNIYADGQGVVKNERTAVEWYQKAAEQNNASAQNALGYMYTSGKGVTKSEVIAAEYFQKAADQGNIFAQGNLGVAYINGQGVAKNERTAVEWFQKAAEQGYAEAQYNLGTAYANGRGVVKNERTAVQWFQKAAYRGYAKAQYNLGIAYANGRGVIKNERTSVEWYQKAANQGDVIAQYELSMAYAVGNGVVRNYQTAYFWSLLANAGDNDEDAKKMIEILEKELTPEQKQAAQNDVTKWQPKQ